MSWKYPDMPAEEESQYPQDFELKAPVVFDSVSTVCGENSVRVEAMKDLLGIGKHVSAAEVTLGGCPATGEDAQVLVFESELHGCGSELVVRVERGSSHQDQNAYFSSCFCCVFFCVWGCGN